MFVHMVPRSALTLLRPMPLFMRMVRGFSGAAVIMAVPALGLACDSSHLRFSDPAARAAAVYIM